MLEREPWSNVSPLRVRMGLHTGEAELRDGDYFGTAVNRAGRLVAVAIVISLAALVAAEWLARRAGMRFHGE